MLNPGLTLARYGLGQMNIASENFRNAATSLEQIISLFLDEASTLSLLSSRTSQHVSLDRGPIGHVVHEQVGEAMRILQVLASELPPSGRKQQWLYPLYHHPAIAELQHTVPETFVAIAELMRGRDRVEAFKTALELYQKQIDRHTRHNTAAEKHNSADSTSHRIQLVDIPKIPLCVHNNAAVSFYQCFSL